MTPTDRRKTDTGDLTLALVRSLTRGDLHTARLILKGSPRIAGLSAWTASIAADPDGLAARLAEDAGVADRADPEGGSTPLQGLASSRAHRLNPDRADAQLQCALLLLAAGADPNAILSSSGAPDAKRMSVLELAITNAQFPALVELLLDHGASIADAGALRAAARQSSPRCLEILLERGADAGCAGALQAAVCGENPGVVETLLNHGATPREVDEHLRSPLHWACSEELSPELVTSLIDAGADLDAQDHQGLSAHRIAARQGCTELTDLLIANGATADLDHVDTFYGLCSRGLSDMALTVLSTHPELFDRVSDREEAHLVDAIAKNKKSAVRAMVEVGFSVESSPYGDQPLHVAARYGRHELLYMLLDSQAPLRARNDEERTPLELAVAGAEDPLPGSGDYVAAVQILLEAGARPEPWMRKCASAEIRDLLERAAI